MIVSVYSDSFIELQNVSSAQSKFILKHYYIQEIQKEARWDRYNDYIDVCQWLELPGIEVIGMRNTTQKNVSVRVTHLPDDSAANNQNTAKPSGSKHSFRFSGQKAKEPFTCEIMPNEIQIAVNKLAQERLSLYSFDCKQSQ